MLIGVLACATDFAHAYHVFNNKNAFNGHQLTPSCLSTSQLEWQPGSAPSQRLLTRARIKYGTRARIKWESGKCERAARPSIPGQALSCGNINNITSVDAQGSIQKSTRLFGNPPPGISA